MKKFLVVALSFVMMKNLNAQKDPFEKVQTSFIIGQMDAAKSDYDKIIAKTPALATTQNGYLWKCRILCELITIGDNMKKAPYLTLEAHDLFMKYQALDPNLTALTTSTIASLGTRPHDVLYAANFTIGREFYTAKNYDSAYFYYNRSAELTKLSMKLNLRNNGGALDTFPILMAGYSAQNAKMVDKAIVHYTFAIDKGYGGKEDVDMYKYVLYGLTEQKDKANFEKYYAIAEAKYPKEKWDDYKLEYLERNTKIEDLLDVYTAEDAAGNINSSGYMTYGNMFYNLTPEFKEKIDKDPAKKELYHKKAVECFKKAFAKNSNDGLAAYNLGLIYYYDFGTQDDVYREGLKALQEANANKVVEKDPKKKAAADAAFNAKIADIKKVNASNLATLQELADNAIEWYEKSVNIIKDKAEKNKQEKQSLKSAVNNLTNLFDFKKTRVQGKDVKAFEAFEAKFKMYDAMLTDLK
ncbi:MAG: hypothetical protein ACOVMM_03755 [Chitinophagaceae bacterium]